MRNPINVYLALGSNRGDRLHNLGQAIQSIRSRGPRVIHASSVYETEPADLAEQPWFLNQVIELEMASVIRSFGSSEHQTHAGLSRLSFVYTASRLLASVLEIEFEMGRRRAIPDTGREIDIDLLLFGDAVINSAAEGSLPSTIVPHPRMHLRRFVLEPLSEVAPDVLHPLLGKSISRMLSELRDPLRVQRFAYRKVD